MSPLRTQPLSRADLARAEVQVLSRGGDGNADVLRVRVDGRECVVKDFSARRGPIRWIAPWLVRRELRAYGQLRDHPAVPRVLGRLDALAFAVEYRPGEILGPRLASRVSSRFVGELREAVAAMHARGVVHLDLRHRSNALADADGHPVLLDFTSALCFRPGGWPARFLLPLLAWIDRRAVDKWARQLGAVQPASPVR